MRLADLQLVRIDARLKVLADSGCVLHLREVAAPAPTRVRDQSDGESLLGERSQRIFDVGEYRRRPGDDRAVDRLVDRIDQVRVFRVQPRALPERPDLVVRWKLAVFGPQAFEQVALAVIRVEKGRTGRLNTAVAEQGLEPHDPEPSHGPGVRLRRK